MRVFLEKIRLAFEKCLGEELVGLYVHGSLAFGCFRHDVSDVDLLAVVKDTPTLEKKIALIEAILALRKDAPTKGIEMSVVREDVLDPFIYPTPYELHYSEFHFSRAKRDIREYCLNMNGVDKDLAAHCTVIRAVGFALTGKPIADVFGEVPYEDYLDSILFDVENAASDISDAPVYIILNLCRVLAAVREGAVLSKKDGGLWGIRHLPSGDHAMIENALAAYEGQKNYVLCGRERDFAVRMHQMILNERKVSL